MLTEPAHPAVTPKARYSAGTAHPAASYPDVQS